MPGVIYHDLVGDALTEKRYDEIGTVVHGGSPGTLGKPVVLSDCPALFVDNGVDPDTYLILGLQKGAVTIEESEERRIVRTIQTGKPNLIETIQGEDAVNIVVKGRGLEGYRRNQPHRGGPGHLLQLGADQHRPGVRRNHDRGSGLRVGRVLIGLP
jgi:hypothetical protein